MLPSLFLSSTQGQTTMGKIETASIRRCVETYTCFLKQAQRYTDIEQIYGLLLHTECTIQVIEHKDAIKVLSLRILMEKKSAN